MINLNSHQVLDIHNQQHATRVAAADQHRRFRQAQSERKSTPTGLIAAILHVLSLF